MIRLFCAAVFFFMLCGHAAAQSWTSLGPEGGFFKDFAFHPTNSALVYAGSDDGGGVWKSTDAGASWSLLTADFPNFTGWHVEVDPNNPQTIYACEMYGRYGLLKSTDGGTNWTPMSNGLNSIASKQVSKLAIASSSGDTLLISTGEGDDPFNAPRPGDGVFRTTDGGTSWQPSGFQGLPVHCVEYTAGTVFAGVVGNGLHVSNDFGQSWTLNTQIPDTTTIYQIEAHDSIVAVAARSGVYLSTNYGGTFSFVGLAGDFNFDIAILPSANEIRLIVPTAFGPQYYSTATGVWTAYSSPFLNNQLIIGVGAVGNEIYLSPFSSTLIVKSSDNGQTWNRLANNPIATEIPALLCVPNSATLYATLQNSYSFSGSFYNNEALAKSNDNGNTWQRINLIAHGLDIEMDPTDTATLYLGTFAQGLFKTTDGFATWSNIRSGNKLIGDIVLDPENSSTLLLAEIDLSTMAFGIYRSTDNGTNWSLSAPLVANRMAFVPQTDTCYAATENGLYLSTDKGSTWGTIPVQLTGENVLSLAVHSKVLYAGTESGNLYRYYNGTIATINGNWVQPVEVKNIYFSGNELLVGLNGAEQDTTQNLSGSLWHSSDFGTSWTNISTDLPNTNIFGTKGIASRNGQLYLGTYGCGVQTTSDLALAVTRNQAPEELYSYPNPTKDQLTISFPKGVQNGGRLCVYSSSGKIVLSENCASNKCTIDVSDYPIGHYTYQIVCANGKVYRGKFAVVR